VIVRGLITRLVVTLGLWVLLTGGCFLCLYLHLSEQASILASGGFILLFYGWYVYIPVLLVLVSVAWFIAQRIGRMQKRDHAPRWDSNSRLPDTSQHTI